MLILAPFAFGALATAPAADCEPLAAIGWETAGWILLLAGTVFRFWATAYIGGSKGKRLVSEGPYSMCRNPLYFGTFLITLSVAAFLRSPIFAVGVVLASCVYLTTTVGCEERRLRGRLGAEYTEYCRRVPRFWPRFSRVRTCPTVEVNVRCLKIEAIRALRWAAIPLVVHLVLHFRTILK
jgi:protein-S-isoprenylcysteine O-methyltransferase Ste14